MVPPQHRKISMEIPTQKQSKNRRNAHPDRLLLDIQRQVTDDDLDSLARRLFLLYERVHLRSGSPTTRDGAGVLGSGSGLLVLLRTGGSRGRSGTGGASAATTTSTGTLGSAADDLMRKWGRGGVRVWSRGCGVSSRRAGETGRDA